ncbi:MAG: flavodoxin family protein [Candidatus Cloacimonetes bacterium]|nr:flavodoxin family protein [Candidatus Cloacimonadota bacterium]
MKLSAFIGSPRIGGNTEILVRQALAAAGDAGADTTAVTLNEKSIRGCQGCMGCLDTRQCVIADDMQELYPLLTEADAIVIGTPIYFFQMTAQTKLFIDRLYCLCHPNNSRLIGNDKPTVLVITHGAEAGVFQEYVKQTQDMLAFCGFNLWTR